MTRAALSPALPALAALGGVACLAWMDAWMKGAALAAGVLTATWLRAVLGLVAAGALWATRRPRWPGRPALRLHLERGLVSGLMALTFFYSLTKLAIAEAIAISFVAPLVTLYLARVLLGETIAPRAVAGSVIGLAGTLVIVGGKIGAGEVDADAALGLAAIIVSSLLYAYNFIVIRRQSQAAGPAEVAVFHSGVPALLLLPVMPMAFSMPTPPVWAALAVSALLTVLGAMLIAYAYARAPAHRLVPLEYSGFLWALLFGWLYFGERVSAATLAGAAMIVAGCWIGTRPARVSD